MAFQNLDTTQPDQSDGDPISEAYIQQNTDNHNWHHHEKPMCRAYASGSFSHNSSESWLPLTFDSERFDIGGMHSVVTNTSRITIPTSGIYLLGGRATFAASATGNRDLRFRSDGSLELDSESVPNQGATFANRLGLTSLVSLTAGQYVELEARQNSGGTLAITSHEFWAIWMGALS